MKSPARDIGELRRIFGKVVVEYEQEVGWPQEDKGKPWTDAELRVVLSDAPTKENCVKHAKAFGRGYGSLEQIYRWAATSDPEIKRLRPNDKFIAQIKRISNQAGEHKRKIMSDLPEWTFRGGYFRPGFSTKDVPTPWTGKTGLWKRDELVPFGKASDEYREKYYRCPDCDGGSLVPGEQEYTFMCSSCQMKFGWGFGGLYEKRDQDRYAPDDF